MMKEITISVNLPVVWQKAEVDFQTSMLVSGSGRKLTDLADALVLEPDFFSTEWSLRTAEIVDALVPVSRVSITPERFCVSSLVPATAPEGVEDLVQALAESYLVRSLLGAWNELRHESKLYDWRTGAYAILEKIRSVSEAGCPPRITGRRSLLFP